MYFNFFTFCNKISRSGTSLENNLFINTEQDHTLKRLISTRTYFFKDEADEDDDEEDLMIARQVKPNRVEAREDSTSENPSGLSQTGNDPFGSYFASRLPFRM